MSAQKVVILTGASRGTSSSPVPTTTETNASGIGLAIAHYLLQHSTNLVVVARSRQPLEDLSAQYPGQVAVLAGDLADFRLGERAHELASRTWKRLDGVIVNHGVLAPVKKVAQSEAEEWRSLFDVNVFSAVAMACLPSLRETKGRVILCSSGAAANAYSTWGAYGASKATLNHLAMTLAVEEPAITTLSIRPGVVDTDMQRDIREVHHSSMDAKDAAKFAELKQTGGLLRPEQPGNVMARLVLDAPKELNGMFLSWNDEKLSAFQDS
ncbi:hypothetical protein MBLNU457_6057t2 [Dothideomycetes sp. NU457]